MAEVVTTVPWDPVVEHVARALVKAAGGDPDKQVQVENSKFYVPLWQAYIPAAEQHRAAYEAMRETEKDKVH